MEQAPWETAAEGAAKWAGRSRPAPEEIASVPNADMRDRMLLDSRAARKNVPNAGTK